MSSLRKHLSQIKVDTVRVKISNDSDGFKFIRADKSSLRLSTIRQYPYVASANFQYMNVTCSALFEYVSQVLPTPVNTISQILGNNSSAVTQVLSATVLGNNAVITRSYHEINKSANIAGSGLTGYMDFNGEIHSNTKLDVNGNEIDYGTDVVITVINLVVDSNTLPFYID